MGARPGPSQEAPSSTPTPVPGTSLHTRSVPRARRESGAGDCWVLRGLPRRVRGRASVDASEPGSLASAPRLSLGSGAGQPLLRAGIWQDAPVPGLAGSREHSADWQSQRRGLGGGEGPSALRLRPPRATSIYQTGHSCVHCMGEAANGTPLLSPPSGSMAMLAGRRRLASGLLLPAPAWHLPWSGAGPPGATAPLCSHGCALGPPCRARPSAGVSSSPGKVAKLSQGLVSIPTCPGAAAMPEQGQVFSGDVFRGRQCCRPHRPRCFLDGGRDSARRWRPFVPGLSTGCLPDDCWCPPQMPPLRVWGS